jgi:hypothetical protein
MMETGEFTAEELAFYHNRFLDILREGEFPTERGIIYIMFTILRMQHVQGASLDEVIEQVKSIWMVVLQIEHGLKLSGGN